MKTSLISALTAGLVALGASAASAATIVNATGDRTVIRDGDSRLTFLDLTLTQGDTPAEALARPETMGFGVADFGQTSSLLGAFGIMLPTEPDDSFTTFSATDDQVLAFGDALGFTSPIDRFGNFSISGLFDGRFDYGTQVRLANAGAPGAGNFISNANDRDGNSVIGVFMVDVAPVPLPASAFLLIGGMGGLAALRRRRSKRA